MQDGWFRTNDLGHLEADGRLRVTGRADEVIISGGVKVARSRGRRPAKYLPFVDDAVVMGISDEEWGERVVAFVVHADGAVATITANPEEAERQVRALFPEQGWAPKQLERIEEIPLLPNGKVDRMRLRALA